MKNCVAGLFLVVILISLPATYMFLEGIGDAGYHMCSQSPRKIEKYVPFYKWGCYWGKREER